MTIPMHQELPDPLGFAADALAAQGALVELTEESAWTSVLPPALARDLGLPETCTLVDGLAAQHEDVVACGIGSPLLEKLGEQVRAQVAVASLSADLEPPRPAHARALAERLALRNAVFEVVDVAMVEALYLVSWIGWSAEADDRYEGSFALAVHADDGAEPDPSLVSLADPTRASSRLGPAPLPAAGAIDAAAGRLVQRAASYAQLAVLPARAAVARRLARDHRRIEDYFSALIRDARAPKRRIDPAAMATKMAHLTAERDAKLRDLGERYAMRVTLVPLALVSLCVPAVQVRLRVRRRKREGHVVVRLPSGAASLDRLACEGCAAVTARPALCDDRLHVLCESCVPQAQGRPDCAAC
jgi:hypothetical protein